MTKILRHLALLLLVAAAPVFAQTAPRIGYVYPAGGKQGSTFTMTIGGQFLFGVTNWGIFLSGDCAKAKVLNYERPLNPKERMDMEEELKKLQDKRKNGAGLSPADLARAEEIKRVLTQFGRRPLNPALSEFVTVQFTVATNAAPGDHEIRVKNFVGLSNPLKFCVGQISETTKPNWKSVPKNRESTAPTIPPPANITVKLPAVINGQITPAGVDRYHFTAQRGQQIIVAVEARRLIPYLADAVPGWFEATLTILDAKGKELASAERYRFRPDPTVRFEVPADGSYTVEIRDSLYRGREDFVYRMTIGELPFVTGIFPLGGKAGKKTSITLSGWNLPAKTFIRENAEDEAGTVAITGKAFNSMPFDVNSLPEATEIEPNNSRDAAQPITLPLIINGHIGQPGERDVFKFEGHAGQTIVAEVLARRLDSPLDSSLLLTDAQGKTLASNDDFEDKGSGLNTHHADSYFTAKLPANGTYFVHLTDTQSQGGPEFAYRLRLSEPQPDFELRVMPSSLTLRAGMSAPLKVFALRRDGFTNAITLELKNAPAGFSLSGARIGENEDKAQFTLKAPLQAYEKPLAFIITGRATIGGRQVTRTATPTEDMMQAFIYRHLVPSRELAVTVANLQKQVKYDVFKITSPTPVKIPLGGTATVHIGVPAGKFTEKFKLVLDSPPEGISLKNVSSDTSDMELVFACDAAKVKPGSSGNLICSIAPKADSSKDKKKAFGSQPRNESMVTLPAIPFTVSAK